MGRSWRESLNHQRNGHRAPIPTGGVTIDPERKKVSDAMLLLSSARKAHAVLEAEEKEVADLLEHGRILADEARDDALRAALAAHADRLKGFRDALRPLHALGIAFAAEERAADHRESIEALQKMLVKDADEKKPAP